LQLFVFIVIIGRNFAGGYLMKKDIHPKYIDCTVVCACGEVIQTRSTKPNIKVDICSKCHPFFTGTQKFVDTAGRVEKFRKKYKKKGPQQ